MDVFNLLTLPTTSSGGLSSLASLRSDGSGSPPRKARRLENHDATHSPSSALRSRTANATTSISDVPIQIKVVGTVNQKKKRAPDPIALLQRCIRITLDHRKSDPYPATYEQIYNACICAVQDKDNCETLIHNLHLELEKCVSSMRTPYLAKSTEGLAPIRDFNEMCAWYDRQTRLLQSLLTHLDEIYTVSQPKISSLRTHAYKLYKEQIFQNLTIVSRLQECVSSNINELRQQEGDSKTRVTLLEESRTAIQDHIGHLQSHNEYSAFEHAFISFTKSFYEEEGDRLAKDLPAPVFVKRIIERMHQEAVLSSTLLLAETRSPVQACIEEAFVEKRASWVASALPALLEEGDHESLTTLNEIFRRIDQLEVLRAAFRTHVKNTVSEIVKDKDHDEDMVSRLIAFRSKCDTAARHCFLTPGPPNRIPDMRYHEGLLTGFTEGFKSRRSKPAELIAKRLDELLRKGSKGDDAAFKNALDDVIQLCRHTDDKDVFRAFYLRSLAKRLLVGRSASNEDELGVLDLLNNDVPDISTSKNYFTDITLSQELNESLHRKHPALKGFSAMVLQQGYWPFSTPTQTFALPAQLDSVLQTYRTFYKAEKTVHSSRKLLWLYGLCTATLTARFKKGTKELSVSLFQAIVLLLFNDEEKATWTLAEIRENAGLEEEELKRTLQSLACGKKRVLKKIPAGRDVLEGDEFQFNADFQDPRPRVHINSIQVKETAEEHRRTEAAIQEDRKSYLDAAIVRIMKAKKELSYEQLKTETIEAVNKHFIPDVADIKKRVEALTESEYMERKRSDDGEREMNIYVYVA